MNYIDLKIVKTEKLMPEEIDSLFIPTIEFNQILARDHVFMIGPKGSGKSMILHYLSFPVQMQRLTNNSKIPFDELNIGLYIKCNEHYFGSAKAISENESIDYWQNRFCHIFNITISEKLLYHLLEFRSKLNIPYEEEKNFCMEVNELLNLDNPLSFETCYRALRRENINLFKDRENLKTPISHYSSYNFLLDLQQSLQRSILMFRNKNLIILLDEYQELSFLQQKIISEILSVRKPIFKIASLPTGLRITRENPEHSLDINHDFKMINLHTKNITQESPETKELEKFFIKMANKRLESFSITIEELLGSSKLSKSKNKNLYSGLENYVLLSSGNSNDFLDLLNVTISKWDGKETPIKDDLQDLAVREFSRKQMEMIDYIPGITPHKLRSTIQKIGLLLKNYAKEMGRYYLQLGIKDPENISPSNNETLTTAFKYSYLMEPNVERHSRDGHKLFSISLKNSLLPYFDISVKSHQVRELTSKEFERLMDTRSVIDRTEIVLTDEEKGISEKSESLDNYFPYLEEIVDHIKSKRCVFFIGSGLSTAAGYPTGRELTKRLAEHFGTEYQGEDISIIAERILASGRTEGDLIRYIKSTFEKSKNRIPDFFYKFVELGVDTIFTTNWDDILETVFRERGIKFEVLARDEVIPIADKDSKKIYKIHGDFGNADKFVIREKQILNIGITSPAIMRDLANALTHNHFVIVGYGMSDWDFKTIRNIVSSEIGNFSHTSFATVINLSKQDISVLKLKGIIPLKLKGQELIEKLHSIMMKDRGINK